MEERPELIRSQERQCDPPGWLFGLHGETGKRRPRSTGGRAPRGQRQWYPKGRWVGPDVPYDTLWHPMHMIYTWCAHDLFAKDWSLMSFCFVSYTFSLSGANWGICIHILDKRASSQDITLHCICDMQSVLGDLLWSMFMTHTQTDTHGRE